MSSTPLKQPHESATNANNRSLGKRKKTQRSKGSYLSKWLDKTMHHIQDSTPSMDTYESIVNGNLNWPIGGQFAAAGFDPTRLMYAQEPMSLPTLPTYYNPSLLSPYCGPDYRYVQSANKSIQVQRPRQRLHKAEEIHCTPMGTPNGTLGKDYSKAFSEDFASLPPIVTSVGDTTSNSDLNTNEKDDSNARRYSDPCIQGLPDVARPANGDVDSGSDDSSGLSGSQVGTKLLSCLIDQITTLKMANERLNKELQDTKAELTSTRQQNSIWQKSTSSSLGGTPNHSPLANNGLLGASYTPGLLIDLVREIRDAARMREEALYSRVRAMVHERTDNGMSSNESKFSERSLDDIKSSLRASEADRRRMMERISKLEDELRLHRVSSGLDTHENGTLNGSTEDVEGERLRLRKELSDMRRQKTQAEDHALKLERLVTQLRSKFNGLQLSPNGPESIASEPDHEPSPRPHRPSDPEHDPSIRLRRPSDADHDPNTRIRRTSINSSSNSTVVFGPVTDL